MDRRMKRCLILGSALCLWRDIEGALELSEFEGVIAAKRAGVLWKGKLDAWVTLHPDRAANDIQERKRYGYPDAERVYSHNTTHKHSGITHRSEYKFKEQNISGSSGLFAVKVALELGFTHLVLCGMPLSRDQGKLGVGPRWNDPRRFQMGFLEALPTIKEHVRSMSGWTAEQLGKPTAEWLRSDT